LPTKPADVRQRIIDEAQQIVSRKGYAGVGLSEILGAVSVPKGSFYYWFASKDALGEAILENYFRGYLASIDAIVAMPTTGGHRLAEYWRAFYEMQTFDDCVGKCLVVKLGAEVSDLSESMRNALITGTTQVIDRVQRLIEEGIDDGSVATTEQPRELAENLYSSWVGASILAKINRNPHLLDIAMASTLQALHSSGGTPPRRGSR
jgi:TetR/AcrR family transcriptional repressor of nem operon